MGVDGCGSGRVWEWTGVGVDGCGSGRVWEWTSVGMEDVFMSARVQECKRV